MMKYEKWSNKATVQMDGICRILRRTGVHLRVVYCW